MDGLEEIVSSPLLDMTLVVEVGVGGEWLVDDWRVAGGTPCGGVTGVELGRSGVWLVVGSGTVPLPWGDVVVELKGCEDWTGGVVKGCEVVDMTPWLPVF